MRIQIENAANVTSGKVASARITVLGAQTFLREVGYLGYDARAADLIFQLVSRRYEHRSLLITTNLPFKRWDTVFPGAP